MRRLILLRHAKSDHPAGVADRERPLNPRGRRAAPVVGAHLAAQRLIPDLALVSPARRARETWEAAADALGELEVQPAPEIYEAPWERVLDAIRATPDAVETLLVVGHNPGLGDLAQALAGEGPHKLLSRLASEFPTAAYAVIDLDAEHWAAIEPKQGRLEMFVRPRDIDPDLAG